MNYNRRATRPDSHFYRDQRKISLKSRSRARIILKPISILMLLASIALILWWIYR